MREPACVTRKAGRGKSFSLRNGGMPALAPAQAEGPGLQAQALRSAPAAGDKQ
jgi:hypothetical protein